MAGRPRVFVCALDSGKRTVFVPVARLKDEDGVLRVPYSRNHVGETPDVDGRAGVSAECERGGYATTPSRLREPGSAEIRHITADDVRPSESHAPWSGSTSSGTGSC